ncbi:hypothetical protein CVT23_20485 [Minwuia thermotolerans]|uniref:Uncharacterized protein n=1 Tax=Minwuia thermotolerans TaxID=2056226 RepID=A0A2M9FWL9_9PROT|nr:hypothetical protein CVT23_20485 [Minwuia thermotolerans]
MTATHDLTLRWTLANDSLDGSGVISLSNRLDAEAISASVVATRGRMMLEYARDNGGIGLTKSGALNRKFLAWAVEVFDWPGYEPAEVYAVNKVVDEIDYLPGWYLHEVMKRRTFMRKHKDRLLLSPAGREALDRPGLLQAELFPETFKGRYLPSLDAAFMGDFDLYFGLLLWQVRRATEGWASAREIFRAAVIPDDAIHELGGYRDAPIHGFHLRVLRFLTWFGVLEPAATDPRRFDADEFRYRATPLFDRFVHFHIAAGGGTDVPH